SDASVGTAKVSIAGAAPGRVSAPVIGDASATHTSTRRTPAARRLRASGGEAAPAVGDEDTSPRVYGRRVGGGTRHTDRNRSVRRPSPARHILHTRSGAARCARGHAAANISSETASPSALRRSSASGTTPV